jgi:glycosyltransferase involved in cell wall biosynthesis
MREMKILYCEKLKTGSLGTQSTHVYEVVTNLVKLGHHVVLLNRNPPRDESKIDIRQQSWSNRLKSRLIKSRILRPFTSVITIIWLFYLELQAFISAFIIIVREKQPFDLIYRRNHLFSSEYILARLFKIPSIKEVNGIYRDELKSRQLVHKMSLWMLDKIERDNMPKADKIVTVTDRMKVELHKEYGIPENQIAVIPNGANINLFKPMDTMEVRGELGLNPEYRYVCFVGNLLKWLGIEKLINCAPLVVAQLPDTKFLIVGDGEIKEELKSLAGSLGIADNFIFTGMVPYPQVPLYINAADVCVAPAALDLRNSKSGASPLKLHEYMACGRPVVAGDVEGDIQEIADSGLGFVVDSTNAQEMAGAIVVLLKNEPMRREMGERARKLVVEKYSWYKNAQQVAEVCQSVVKQYNLLQETKRK